MAGGILETLAAGVLVVSADDLVVYGNAAAGRILGRPSAALLGRSVVEVFPVLAPGADSVDAGDGRREGSIPTGAGGCTVVGYSVGPASADGHRTILFQEIGGLLALRRERDRLLQLAALGDALPSILHELRNPLAAVTSSLEILVEEAVGSQREDLHAVLWEVRRINLTLHGVGGLVRSVHVGQHVAIDHAVREACRILANTAAQRGVRLEADIETMPLIPLDWGVVNGVVFNIVKNALDACSAGDHIRVEVRLEQRVFVLRVVDTGLGMDAEVLARCRELFFTKKEHGSGIGLALCQQVAEASGGRLDIVSEPGQGTAVTLRIPLRPHPHQEPNPCLASTA
ncbi:MAG: PAS domain-containing protein [Kofleriaceae bacterium]|nr:PAS domain-containing protein [Kofleriaceae bacterium]